MISLLISPLLQAKDFYFCNVQIENNFPLERGFINAYLTSAMERILLETGWVKNCKKGKPVKVKVTNLTFRGSSISGNRFSGYQLNLSFNLQVEGFNKSYTYSRFVALPDPSLGTLVIRKALPDLFETYSLKLKADLLNYMKRQKEEK